jgi:[ribosomal protein S5]-alanine N-acetyltransferase
MYKSENKVIGFAGLKYLPELGEADLEFRFLPEYWNKGIATEASLALLDYGFMTLKLERIIAIAMVENIGSQRVLEKSGMVQYKTGEYDGDGGEHLWYEIGNASVEIRTK